MCLFVSSQNAGPQGTKGYSIAAQGSAIPSGPAAAAHSSPYGRNGGAGVRSPPAAGQIGANRFASPRGSGDEAGAAAAAGRAAAGGTGTGVPMSSPRIDGKEFFRQARYVCYVCCWSLWRVPCKLGGLGVHGRKLAVGIICIFERGGLISLLSQLQS